MPKFTPLINLLLLLSLLAMAGPASADLMLYPTRIVMEKTQRAAQVELINQGKTPETYRISFVNRRMGENGEFIAIDSPAPGELFADAMLRFSPRQVTIPPGGSQTVRIQLRRPAELASGEYRSHLQFERVAETNSGNSVENAATDAGKEVGVVLNALVGASIPVIVRHGEVQVDVALSDLNLLSHAEGAQPVLGFALNRSGNRSVYGDFQVFYAAKGKAPIEVAKAGGVAVYTPNSRRLARMPLNLPEGAKLEQGSLQVVFRDRPEFGGKTLAEAKLALP
ncbi:fimbrial biogenesis chaperone [Roseateles oligotrophus]|uniref:Molecular chaperone n=1 Tax=Roseateles oligotrophus TaxID=1769250 RepID=A0ABT2YGV0_9BURK|nr:molecular chaperone [Roseateles oligotrophus]MCV2369273.1 molecular chaperone [Roseateles oligotrophus]